MLFAKQFRAAGTRVEQLAQKLGVSRPSGLVCEVQPPTRQDLSAALSRPEEISRLADTIRSALRSCG